MKRKTTKTELRVLQNDCYDILSATYNRNSKFYQSDCDDLWAHLLTRNEAQLRETLSRQRAIANVTQAELNQHCQFEGLI